MLAIRMQRTGRSGHAQFRVIVQDARSHPKSGRVVEYLGSYNPHTKTAQLKGEEISGYLSKGAQPSDRVAKLLKAEGIKLPAWVSISPDKKRAIRNPEKLRRNAPPAEKAEATAAPEPAEKPAEAAEPADKTEDVAEAEPAEDSSQKSDEEAVEPASAEPVTEKAKEEVAVAPEPGDEKSEPEPAEAPVAEAEADQPAAEQSA